MRHGDVAYFDADGGPCPPEAVSLTPTGRAQAQAAGLLLAGLLPDRIVTSGLPRTVETAHIVLDTIGAKEGERATGTRAIEVWPELCEIRGGRLREIPDAELENAFLSTCQGLVAETTPFLQGETIGALLDRVIPALDRLLADPGWDTVLMVLHGAVNRAILSRALLGTRGFLGGLEQAAGCLNILDVGRDWIVRAVNISATDPAHRAERTTTMEALLRQYCRYRTRTA